jgi:hypothetical protein
MAVIYMTHPVHGAKVAISDAEAIYDEMSGWMRYDPEAPAAASIGNALASRGRGRPRVKQEE